MRKVSVADQMPTHETLPLDVMVYTVSVLPGKLDLLAFQKPCRSMHETAVAKM